MRGRFIFRSKTTLFTTAAGAVLRGIAICKCGWEFNTTHLVAVPGFSAITDRCPKCGTLQVLVYQTVRRPFPRTRFVKSVEITGKNEPTIRAALRKVPDITESDIDFMLAAVGPEAK